MKKYKQPTIKFSGIVKKHLGRGRKLGYPTANLDIDSKIQDGLYLGTTEVGKKKYPSLIFVGAPATFDNKERQLESYLLNFSGDLYGQQITIETIRKIRDNKKFETQEALVTQMRQDEVVARKFFKHYNINT